MPEFNATITGNVKVLRRDRETRRHSLEQLEGEGAPRQINIDGHELVIGRATESHIRLSSHLASRLHGIFRICGTDCVLEDNDSHNGVYLNGIKICSAVLREGDVIQVADGVFVYHEE
jgi:pSer/pThr/pTyr-binding forkhead associated (FHA) protein